VFSLSDKHFLRHLPDPFLTTASELKQPKLYGTQFEHKKQGKIYIKYSVKF